MIRLPKVLKNLNLFVDGRGYAGRVDEVELPKLSIKAEEHRAGGMDLPVAIDLGMEKLEATLTVSDFDPDLFRLWGLAVHNDVPLTIRGAVQAQGEAAVPVAIHLRGGWRELDGGAWKPGDKSTVKVAVAATYYKLVMDGEVLVEIDAVNLVRRVGGQDQMEAIRAAIGM